MGVKYTKPLYSPKIRQTSACADCGPTSASIVERNKPGDAFNVVWQQRLVLLLGPFTRRGFDTARRTLWRALIHPLHQSADFGLC